MPRQERLLDNYMLHRALQRKISARMIEGNVGGRKKEKLFELEIED